MRPSFILIVIGAVISLQAVDSVPVPSSRSVNLNQHQPNSVNENSMKNLLLLHQQHQQQKEEAESDFQSILEQRKNKTGDGFSITSTSGDGSNDEEGDGASGISNDTQAGSRLKQNETEPCNQEPGILCSSDPMYPNRDKTRRMTAIVHFFESIFNRTRPNKEITRDRLNPVNPSSGTSGGSSFSGDIKSITATCDLPSDVESEAWLSERYLNLFFNVTSKYPDIFGLNQNSSSNHQDEQQSIESGQSHEPTGTRPFLSLPATSTQSKALNVVSAKLRLYKVGLSQSSNVLSFTTIVPSQPSNDTDLTLRADEVVPSAFPTTMTFPNLSPSVEERVRVSVSWYTQPATKNHYKKKTLDSKMLSVRESEWVEFDIKNAVQAWLNYGMPNYGLVVEVESENQDAVDPTKHFGSSSCFMTSSPSSEGELMYQKNDNVDTGTRYGGNQRRDEDKTSITTLPSIEICTLNERRIFLPNDINIHSLNHLKGVAESHAKSNRNGPNQPKFSWQNVNVQVPSDLGITFPDVNSRNSDNDERPTSTVIVPSHRHRHHHQLNSENRSSHNTNSESTNEQNQPPKVLDDDHPLRMILAASVNSKESSRRGSSLSTGSNKRFTVSSHHKSEMLADEGKNDSDESNEHKRNGFFTTIIMTPEQLKANARNGFPNPGMFPFPLSISSVTPTHSANMEASLER